jgi:hypothetical protein
MTFRLLAHRHHLEGGMNARARLAPVLLLFLQFVPAVASAELCATPGKDLAGGVLAGVVNRYHPGAASAAAGSASITLGVARGAATPITAGDLLLVIQMQDALINATAGDSYGDGVAGEPASGATSTEGAGQYEFVRATNSVGAGGGALNLVGGGAGGGLVHSYSSASAVSSRGARRFQVVRVPQYTSATLGSTLTAEAWDGSSGGVLALDVRDVLALGSATVSVTGQGFRGGAGVALAGGAGSSADIRSASSAAYHGGKGEGIAGAPRYMWNGTAVVDQGAVATLPNGDRARGAPGNAGGGGTDGAPLTNTENSGGGGGGNGGSGGNGGHTWSTQLAIGGCGGGAFADAGVQRAVMGGGGGSGSRNGAGLSHGGAGGGIVFIRAHAVTGTGTLAAQGTSVNTVNDDGGGGGGAGGSVVVAVRTGTLTGLTVDVRGGQGGRSNTAVDSAGPIPGNRYGPGGGGGGGVAMLSATAAAVLLSGGAAGTTCRDGGVYGATSGASGILLPLADESALIGAASGARCFNAPPSVIPPPDQLLGPDTVWTFSSAAGNRFVISDQDAGAFDMELRVIASGGVGKLATLADLTVTGDGTASIVATGTLHAIVTALDGFEFRRPGATSGPGLLQLILSDLGHDGFGGSLSDTALVILHWGALDVAPGADELQFASVRSNPSRGPVQFEFALPRPGSVRLDVFDPAGRRVGGIAPRDYPAGRSVVPWRTEDREALAPGVYRVVLRAESGTRVRSFVVVR